MAELCEITEFLDRELRLAEVPDYPGAHNGLQLENDGRVSKVATAVDASLAVVEKAVEAGADLLVVHHGLFWQGVRMLTGGQYRKFKAAFDGNLAIYSAHIPLDVHPQWGNNALLAQALGLEVSTTFLPWKGLELGLAGEWQGTWEDLLASIQEEVGPIISFTRSQQAVGRLGLVTGGAGSEVETVRAAGIDTFLTGEGPHWSFPLADELGLNVIHAGHYATETSGVRKVGELLSEKFKIEEQFLPSPTGL
ncbi:Nif3-like dinuclear metal center hexameric protein [Roseibacillus ishigakijimensis]|uniref:GTP cyclohydrolase 1 type 2 homolog n=1 Tax=Roseibacillus ishigakijimensis TaxID=454146 RepID=A0A934RR23_9BACT|nr:Nif3-like dinuclear metal center hexameric protein [Roseibacillus ishigakijimensis]MBK1832971.1 Nif3-like dinuclear metal center hexameric protein [Roseibacillus ishigakijimensis]